MKKSSESITADMDRAAGVHRSPRALLVDAIQRSLGWASEDELRQLVQRYTAVTLTLGDSNRFSQEVAAIVVRALADSDFRAPEEDVPTSTVDRNHKLSEDQAVVRAIVMAAAQFVRPCAPRDVLKSAAIDRKTAVAAGCCKDDIEALDEHGEWSRW